MFTYTARPIQISELQSLLVEKIRGNLVKRNRSRLHPFANKFYLHLDQINCSLSWSPISTFRPHYLFILLTLIRFIRIFLLHLKFGLFRIKHIYELKQKTTILLLTFPSHLIIFNKKVICTDSSPRTRLAYLLLL